MGKASEFDRQMEGRFLQPGELWPVRPEVRVRADTPTIEVANATPVGTVLDRLGQDGHGVVLRDSDSTPQAVVLTPERYAELAGCEIESEDLFQATLGDTIEPDTHALEELMIEQVDPAAEWKAGSRIWREPGR
jgi:hypothetical protein